MKVYQKLATLAGNLNHYRFNMKAAAQIRAKIEDMKPELVAILADTLGEELAAADVLWEFYPGTVQDNFIAFAVQTPAVQQTVKVKPVFDVYGGNNCIAEVMQYKDGEWFSAEESEEAQAWQSTWTTVMVTELAAEE